MMIIYLDSFDRAILRILATTGQIYNTNEIARRTRMSWNTAEGHLKRLRRYGYVVYKDTGFARGWRIDV